MEEESSENEVKQSKLNYVIDTQGSRGAKVGENAPRKPIPRYWHTNVATATTPRPNASYVKPNPLFKKVNTPNNSSAQKTNNPTKANTQTVKNNTTASKINTVESVTDNKSVTKEEKKSPEPEPLPPHLLLFQNTNPQHVKKTIELIENDDDDDDNHVVQLESSDEDEVVEVALPPKPTITIESSDDEEDTIQISSAQSNGKPKDNLGNSIDREISTSPAPSIVSSVSDDFIRGDCIALNISSRHPDNHSFDFSLHGADLVVTPSKKKKKKKNKENTNVTSTPIVSESPQKTSTIETCFATPKSKAKNKKQKKLYAVTEKSLPSVDVYDSDSNQSIIDITKNTNTYIVTEKSVPSMDVYESDSNASEPVKELGNSKEPTVATPDSSDHCSDSNKTLETPLETDTSVINVSNDDTEQVETTVIDLTSTEDRPKHVHQEITKPDIQESIMMGNVVGFTEPEDIIERIDHNKVNKPNEVSKYASTKVPAILYENLDFDNLKGKESVCVSRRYSLTTLRAEMEKFYNESWGGEDFNHRELQKHMSRDKSLWVIDPKDRMPSLGRKKPTCNYCNRIGHRDDTCRFKKPVCFMCGNTGHYASRCPSKICVNCGADNYVYSTQCRNCATWCRINCAECGQNGHPSSHCPDIWRRYHNTTDLATPLEENHKTKKYQHLYCSGCTQRGHLVHTCRHYIPFSGLPINSPYVRFYRPVYPPIQTRLNPNNQRHKSPYNKSIVPDSTVPPTPKHDRNKRQSKSPTVHETHFNKKRHMSTSEEEAWKHTKSPGPVNEPQRKLSQSKDHDNVHEQNALSLDDANAQSLPSNEPEKALDFIPIFSSNRDKKGQMIQDNEVSDTSDVVTSARIYVTNDIIDTLKTEEGQQWLHDNSEKHRVVLENSEITSFLSIKGKAADQDAFQTALRDRFRTANKQPNEGQGTDYLQPSDTSFNNTHDESLNNMSKSRHNVLRQIRKSLDSLDVQLGEPKAIYKELRFLQSRHEKLINAKQVSRKQLLQNRQRLKKVCRTLNSVLIGQAGLAHGAKHLAELHALHEKLTNFRQKNIPDNLRREIAYHYDPIFSTFPRNDYNELLQAYYHRKRRNIENAMNKNFSKVTKTKKKWISPHLRKNPLPVVPALNVENDTNVNNSKSLPNNSGKKQPKEEVVKAHFNKLMFYHKRLSQARPYDAVLKKTKTELVRKLHAFIGSLGNNDKTTSAKMLKKVKKVQQQAQVFLNNQGV